MKTSDSVAIARINARAARAAVDAAAIDAVKAFLTNPGTIAVLGTIAIEYFQGHDQISLEPAISGGGVVHQWKKRRVPGGGFVGSIAGSAAEAALIANCLSPLINKALESTNSRPTDAIGALTAVKALV